MKLTVFGFHNKASSHCGIAVKGVSGLQLERARALFELHRILRDEILNTTLQSHSDLVYIMMVWVLLCNLFAFQD